MVSIGISESHDAAVCLLEDGVIKSAIALERLLRVKRAAVSDPVRAAATHAGIEYCLGAAGRRWADVDWFAGVSPDGNCVAFNETMTRRLSGFPQPEKAVLMPHPSHHLAHAYSAFYTSGYEAAAALVIDCYGSVIGAERECETGFVFDGTPKLPERVISHRKPIRQLAHPEPQTGLWQVPGELAGVGEIYRTITLLLGFYQDETLYDEAGKTMGLAPYGTRLSKTPVLLRHGPDGTIDCRNALPWLEEQGLAFRGPKGRVQLVARARGAPVSQLHKNLAAQVQWELEEATLHLACHLRRVSGAKSLVLSGGVFLNATANRRIQIEAGFERVFPFPAATDDGTAVGAAFYAYSQGCIKRSLPCRRTRIGNCSLGRIYRSDEVFDAIRRSGLPYVDLGDCAAAAEAAGRLLSEGKIIGWFQGGSEFGPRALGNRSILADPRRADIKDTLNSRIKFREAFRPFAPAVLAERATEYFEMPEAESPYMLFVYVVRPELRDALPGTTHIDGTARVQTVERAETPLFHDLISSFARRTNLPIVLNTSFNVRGMPIVETPDDAIYCFLLNEMDALVIDRYMLPCPDFGTMIPVRSSLEVVTWLQLTPEGTEVRRVRVSAKGQQAEDASSAVYSILGAMDGASTVAGLATLLGLAEAEVLRVILECCRKGWCSWSGPAGGFGRRPSLLIEPGMPAPDEYSNDNIR